MTPLAVFVTGIDPGAQHDSHAELRGRIQVMVEGEIVLDDLLHQRPKVLCAQGASWDVERRYSRLLRAGDGTLQQPARHARRAQAKESASQQIATTELPPSGVGGLQVEGPTVDLAVISA